MPRPRLATRFATDTAEPRVSVWCVFVYVCACVLVWAMRDAFLFCFILFCFVLSCLARQLIHVNRHHPVLNKAKAHPVG